MVGFDFERAPEMLALVEEELMIMNRIQDLKRMMESDLHKNEEDRRKQEQFGTLSINQV